MEGGGGLQHHAPRPRLHQVTTCAGALVPNPALPPPVPSCHRALKTKGNTPKYGLIFHSSFIGRAKQRNKVRVRRLLQAHGKEQRRVVPQSQAVGSVTYAFLSRGQHPTCLARL